MGKLRLRNIILLALTAVVLLCGVFWRPLFSSFVHFYIRGIPLEALGLQLTSGNLVFENHQWVIENPTLTSVVPLSEGGVSIKADRILFDIESDFLARSVWLDVKIVNSNINVGEDLNLFQKVVSEWKKPSSSFIKLRGSLTAAQGIVIINDFDPLTKEPIPRQKVSYDVQVSSEYNEVSKITLVFDTESSADKNKLEASFLQDTDQSLTAQITLWDVQCYDFYNTIRLINPSLNMWRADAGVLNGTMSIKLQEGQLPQCEGDALISGLQINSDRYGIRGHIQQATLNFNSSPNIASLEFSKGASLLFKRKGEPFWEIVEGAGHLRFLNSEDLEILLTGVTKRQHSSVPVKLQGHLTLSGDALSGFDIKIDIEEKSHEETLVHLQADHIDTSAQTLNVSVKNVGKGEFEVIQHLWKPRDSIWNELEFLTGTFDADFKMNVEEASVKSFEISNLAARQITARVVPWKLYASIEDAYGDFTIDLSAENIIETINAQLYVNNGELCLHPSLHHNSNFNVAPKIDERYQCGWRLKDLKTHFTVKDGEVQKSLIEGELSGLKGTIEFDWQAEEIIKSHFKGGVKDMTFMFPTLIKNGLDNKFQNDQLDVVTGLRLTEFGVKLEGILNFYEEHTSNSRPISFGFDLEKDTKALPSTPEEDSDATAFSPVDWLSEILGIDVFGLRDGWFNADKMPLDKYLAPFIFPENTMRLKGYGDFHGKFDHQGLMVRYDAHELTLENNALTIDVPSLSTGSEKTRKERLVAVHYLDFVKGSHYGTIPVHNATYFERNSGLLFTDVNAKVVFESRIIHIPEIHTYCNGIYMVGGVDFDYTSPEKGVFEVRIQGNTMHGKVSQVQSFISHFKKPLLFLKLPFEGDLAFRKNGCNVVLAFKPDHYNMKAKFHGVLTDGSYAFDGGNVSCHDISFNFDYDHEASALDFWDIHGTILVGDPDHDIDEYFLAGDHIRFNDYQRNISEFDVWVGDKKRDVIRVAGKTHQIESEVPGELVEVELDKTLTHFGDVHPKEFELVLKDWLEVDRFKLLLNFDLLTLFHDLKRFSRTGFLPLSSHLLKDIHALESAKGEFKFDLTYDRDQAQFIYLGSAEKVQIGDKHYDKCLLSGRKKGSHWLIDQLQFDQLSFAADLTHKPEEWKINFLGVRCGESLLLGLDGDYWPEAEKINAHINLLEVNLAKLHEWPSMQEFVKTVQPEGVIKGTGTAYIQQGKETPDFQIDAQLALQCKSASLYDFTFQDSEPFQCTYSSTKGIEFKHIKGFLKDDDLISVSSDPIKFAFLLGAFQYEFKTKNWHLSNFDFSIPANNLAWVSEKLSSRFPEAFSEKTSAIIKNIKDSGHAEGSFSMSQSYDKKQCQLRLSDDTYHLFDSSHYLRNFQLSFNDIDHLKINTQYQYQQQPIWITAHFPSSSMEHGEIILTENIQADTPPLIVFWENVANNFSIVRAQGSLCGLNFNLKRNTAFMGAPGSIHLIGDVKINFQEAAGLMPPRIAEKVHSWDIRSGYTLKGKYDILQVNAKQDWCEHFNFNGILEGHDFYFKGYELQSLMAHVEADANQINIRNVRLNDRAGLLTAEHINFKKDSHDRWSISIPFASAGNFRPSLLHKAGTQIPQSGKPFVIKAISLNNLDGVLDDEGVLEGYGEFEFDNGSKKSLLSNTIFALPVEIISRIGLNPDVLSPVTGTIYYQIHGNRIYFNRFKDVYSNGKLSKFYLSNKPYQSYMDFDGNLNLQVKMKQYNLLFKLAELFTVTVQGTIDNPSYSLQKQGKP